LPVLLTPAGSLGTVRQGEQFVYKLEAFDAEGSSIGFEIVTFPESGFDSDIGGGGFDAAQFDQGEQKLPDGLVVNSTTGWITGTIPSQEESSLDYTFKITPYKYDNPLLRGKGVIYSLRVLGNLSDDVIWKTDSNLGVITEGKRCTIELMAESLNGQGIRYSLAKDYPQQLPQGVFLSTDGLLIGRPSFRKFSVD